MSGQEAALEAIRGAADVLVPQLSRHLAEHRLGEIEVRHGDLRVRLKAAGTPHPDAAASPAPSAARPVPEGGAGPGERGGDAERRERVSATSPAVGVFFYADQLGPGLEVAPGDRLGHVEMLGVNHDVRAPAEGTVTNLVAESGEAVEYGQVLIEMQPRTGS